MKLINQNAKVKFFKYNKEIIQKCKNEKVY